MIFTMCIAFFVIHSSDAFAAKELALIYLIIFVLLFIAGPGRFSVDAMINRKIKNV
jgi:putative oxidoreductase